MSLPSYSYIGGGGAGKRQTTLIKASEPQLRLNHLRAIFIFSAMLSAEQRGCAETELRLRDPARQQSSTVLQMWNLITLMTPQYSARHPTDCGELLTSRLPRQGPEVDGGSELVSRPAIRDQTQQPPASWDGRATTTWKVPPRFKVLNQKQRTS